MRSEKYCELLCFFKTKQLIRYTRSQQEILKFSNKRV